MNNEIEPRPIRSNDHHYVIVVHGTFNKPEPGKYHWAVFDPATPDTFAQRLDERLSATVIGSAVNRMPDGTRQTFVWNAGNTDSDRKEGGWRLFQHIRNIVKEDPNARIHLVGHSHGGNVILCALEHYYRTLAEGADRLSQNPWWAWRMGDKFQSVLSNQPTDLYDAADALVNRIAGRDETLLSTLLKGIGEVLFESRPGTSPLDPETTEYRKYYCASPTWNRLGRIVFLGTPFYLKRWTSRGVVEWLLDMVFNTGSLVLYWGALGYIVATLLLLLPYLIFRHHLPWNPLSWPLAVQIIYVGYITWNTYLGFHGDLRRDGNVYWNTQPIERYSLDKPVFLRSVNKECDGRLSTLTVTAPYMDEALLGMISEPLLFGRMRPELRKFVVPESAGRSGLRLESGVRFTHMVAVRRLLNSALQRLKSAILASVYLVIKLPWRALYDLLVERLVLKAVFGAVSSTATGIPRSEYAGATIEPSAHANVPGLLNENFLDVTNVFLDSPTQEPRSGGSRPETQPAEEPYDFLKNNEFLRKRLAADEQWRAIEGEMSQIARFYRRKDVPAYSDELARRWLAIRTRATTVLENIALTHGRYYADDRVVNGIVEFLANGRLSSLVAQPSPFAKVIDDSRKQRRLAGVQGFRAVTTSLEGVVIPRSSASSEAPIDFAKLLRDLVWVGGTGITRGFVNCAQYRMAAQELASNQFFFYPEHWRGLDYPGDGDEPVGGLRASDAAKFCSWLGRKFAVSLKFRLPTAVEARRVPPSSIGPLCWCEDDGRITCIGSSSYQRIYRESRAALTQCTVPFPHSVFDGLPIRGITAIKLNAPPVDPLIVHLVARSIFNRTAPEDMFTLPSSLGSIVMLIEDLRHARGSLVESRAYAKNLFSTLINGLAADSYKECSQTYRELVAQLKGGRQDEAVATVEGLKTNSAAIIAHTVHVLDDISKASGAESNAEAFAWLQIATARVLEYSWYGHQWAMETERQLEGASNYLARRLMDRLTGRHSAIEARRNELWKFYWWLRLSIARGNGNIPAVEGIRVVCESKRSDVERLLK